MTDATKSRATLPPPELSAPMRSIRRPASPAAEVVERRVGPKADEAGLRARLAWARSGQDPTEIRAAGVALAQFLGGKERDLREAASLARESLGIREDPELRREAARWIETLGDFSAAADFMESGEPDAQAWTRIGVLRARAGQAADACRAFENAAHLDPTDAMSLELRATLAWSAPEILSPSDAAASYLEAAGRRREAGALNGEMEDLLRAVEADPTSEAAATALATALSERGRAAAGEEVLRAQAESQGGSARIGTHLRRFESALTAGDVLRALDAGLAADLDAPPDAAASVEAALGTGFDEVLLRVGLFELLAARLEVAAERAEGPAKAHVLEQVARLCAGPLAAPSRAARAHVQVLACDPSHEDSVLALRAYATATRDVVPLVEGLVRGAAAAGEIGGRLRCARLLSELAEDQLQSAKLARWALSIVTDLAPEDVSAAAGLRRLGHTEEDEGWRSALDAELLAPSRTGGLGRFLLGLDLVPPDEVEARAALAAAARAKRDLVGAREMVRPLVEHDVPTLRGLGVAWVNARGAGDARLVARAMIRTAEFCTQAVQAVVLCEAADRLLRAGDPTLARKTAEKACQADPAAPRPVATLANVVIGARDRTAASALQRAAAMVFARGTWCESLATALEELGETDQCVAWTQRMVAIRPGDRARTRLLLSRVQRAGDSARVADTLDWALPQPQAAEHLAEIAAEGLRALVELDSNRACIVARRALDTFGPSLPALHAAIVDIAGRSGDHVLAAVLEERLAELRPDDPAVWLRVAQHRGALGDLDAESRALIRAVRAGARVTDLAERIAGLEKVRTGDGELCRLELVAELAVARGDTAAGCRAWREVGGALWDLADDRDGAIAAWTRGARLIASGFATMGADLVRFGGAQFALARLGLLLEGEADPQAAGAIAAEAARVALPLGEPARAFDLASLALVKSPLMTGALEVAEKGAVASGRASEMARLYDAVGLRSLGRFGRRAAHYRGARFFEHRGEHELALRHASQAFLAVPSEGATMFLLRRIAEKANDLPTAVRTIVEVAQTYGGKRGSKLRAAWLVRAAALAGPDADSARLRVDVLLQAALLEPRTTTLDMLGDAARALLAASPDDHDTLQLRFGRAAGQLTARLEGPDGARVALSFVDLSLSLFEDADGALSALRHALEADADLDEYALLVPKAELLSTAEQAPAILAEQAAQLEKPYSNVGVFALRILGSMAKHRGDADLAARFLMRAAEREPDDDALLREADAAARSVARSPEHDRFEKKIPKKRVAEALRAFADAERAEGRNETAATALERVIELAEGSERDDAEKALREVYEAAGRMEELERRALREATDGDLLGAARAARWDDVARVREERGDVSGACEALAEAATLDGGPLERWSALERVSTLAGRSDFRVQALREIEVRVKEDARPAVLRRLAIAYEELGDLDAVEGAWQRVLEIAPDDEQADQEIESVIARRGDYERLADHLAKRAKRLANVSDHREKLRVVRLRRVAILEQRLGRANDACAELEQLTKDWPDNDSALRYLADLYERTSMHAKAAPVWKHLASLAKDETTRIDLELRAALAARTAGEGIRASEWTRQILETSPGNVDALSLLAELARASSDDRTLGEALAGLAASPLEESTRRSAWLIEAAQAAARVGDARAALERAQLAARIASDRAETQLFARGLEYRLRGAGTLEDAKNTVAELSKVEGPAVGDDAALLAFLWAEAVDVVDGVGAGLLVLEQARDRIGDHALLSLAMAERLLAKNAFDDALKHLQFAVNGNLLGLRSRGRVAMAGAEAAMRSGVQSIALRMLEIAAHDADTAPEANQKLATLEAELEAKERGEDPPPAGIPSPGPIPLARARHPSGATPAPPVAPPPATPPPAAASTSDNPLRSLREALAAGHVDAGDELANVLGDGPAHTAELVRIRRTQVDLRPGDPRLLADLRMAALADRNPTYARAIDHVARAFDAGAGPVAPPSITAQVEHPGMLGFLVKPAMGFAGEALAHVWDGAGTTLARDPGSYAITGVERVVPGPASVIARLYDCAVRLLDVRNIPLYVRRGVVSAEAHASEPRLLAGVGMPKPGVALLATPSALLTGEVKEESPGACYALGQALSAALPQSALIFGLPDAQSRAVWAAVIASFGPTTAARVAAPESARWTTIFWSTIPGRLQRRIQELLGRDPPEYDALLDAGLQAARRVGLYLSGDIGTAVRATCHEPRIARPVPASTAELQALCAEVPAIADLVRLAVRPEYADARWRVPPEGSGRVTLSSGRYRVM